MVGVWWWIAVVLWGLIVGGGLGGAGGGHPPACVVQGGDALCRGAALTKIPTNLPQAIVKLDLTSNNITELGDNAFVELPQLEELILGDNKISKIHPRAFSANPRLKRLSLQNCGLAEVPWETFQPLRQLTSLQLDGNEISQVEAVSFAALGNSLHSLRLEGNRLTAPPTAALATLPHLEALNLGSNLISSIPVNSFPDLGNLIILLMKRNQISTIDEDAFSNLTALRVLELDDNLLTHIPIALTKLTSLQELSVSGNRIKFVAGGILQRAPSLSLLELKGNPLVGVDPLAFSALPKLRKLILSEARELREVPCLNGTTGLEILRLDRASITSIPSSLCHTCPRLKSLDFKSNKLTRVPDLGGCKDLRVLELSGNQINSLAGRPFVGLHQLHDLLLAHNVIPYLPPDAFTGLTRLQVLDLESNQISEIHPEAFLTFTQLEDLNLGNNAFSELPTAGLERLLHLKTFNNGHLRDFPPPSAFPRVQSLVLSYAYHCCAFLGPPGGGQAPLQVGGHAPGANRGTPLHESVLFPTDNEFDMTLWNSSLTDIWPQLQNLSKKFGTQINELWDNFGSDFTYPGNLPAYVEEYFEEQERTGGGGAVAEGGYGGAPGRIHCLPAPGPFLPCVDLFDWWTLRCGVWVVFLLAMLGNGTVVFVLVFSRSKIDVPRFLVCNLAAADFFMGVYLGMLAVVDASTLGEFRKWAIPWQMSAGCQLAGFLGVLSSELSVYTLAVITLERNYAITHAMHLNKRLSLKHAGYIMLCGWAFAVVLATLPLMGVSDYRKFATCLPFETTTGPWALAYVVFLMFVNGVAFLILTGCYLKMYCAIRGSQAWNSNDSRIAKRMALLVFTDLLCWAPIAFFSTTAAFGLQLVTLEQAKVFTVFVLPLNSCCNPFLYAILTKQFKKDCVLICKAIEESRVTRGIGRCRHSSNFSNRQTPANTNSLVDRSSRDGGQPCSCSAKLLSEAAAAASSPANARGANRQPLTTLQRLLRCLRRSTGSGRHRTRSDQYAYQIAEIQQKQHKRASSVSSSENFSSSRSDSWRQNHNHHHCGIPMRLLDPKRRASSWIVTRKTSQDSNLSSSRNDSSGSATTASTTLSRVSRSSASSGMSELTGISSRGGTKPRLTRQAAVTEVPPAAPPHYEGGPDPNRGLTVRFLATIPSEGGNTTTNDEASDSSTAILHDNGN
ncbi:lutropin-choriogonadotropic hormone receptor [Nilaparvata lugens]|uniref:Neuropeptide GPCR A46 n=1 Tax=Nilaparvata lugens TaxID=108931 RepID=U3U4H2_NILLU|nr:lutropin-choriogonadotropic hormone receptor [Nilaparvata lugens]XP_039295283.1 lutropin-choriogonadotropic hormone receptor [Nilaparvata lugens]BAO01096.1 neuropeptide GPCR A46 [Nilaparvata lugens]